MRERVNAFTLVELLVACALFLTITAIITGTLHHVMKAWDYTEGQNQVHEEARRILAHLREDLQSIYVHDDHRNEVRMLLTRDRGTLRFGFVKRLFSERLYPVLRQAGTQPISLGYKNYYYFLHSSKDLRAPGGLGEVMYILPNREGAMELWRGVRSPIGGDTSFFADINTQPDKIRATCHCIASHVLYLGVECWSDQTQDWEIKDAHRRGVSSLWDSTCRNIPSFFLYQADRTSSVFPLKVRIILVLSGRHTPFAVLSRDIDANQKTMSLKNARNLYQPIPGERVMLRIDNEWISYGTFNNMRLEGVTRGMWNTQAEPHVASTSLYGGVHFSSIVDLPFASGKD